MKERYRVLIADDDKSTRRLYGQIIKKNAEFQVDEAKNGKEALKLIKKSIPDILLCDLYMPDMDGLDLCRYLKKDPDSNLSNIYVIMTSAEEREDYKIRCINEGADDFLTKPVDFTQLKEKIKTLL